MTVHRWRKCVLAACLALPVAATAQGNVVTVDASAPIPAPETGYLHLGGRSVDGHTLAVNSQYLVLDGKPWLPVMGEFHYSRYPEADWEDEILKMKAGGVQIVATYVFWLHQEEVEGQFDWTGQRDLRRFIELCKKHGLYVWIRVGPWAHGEARNGGFPDWVNTLPNVRTNDPIYLRYVERFYGQVGMQVRGLMFKDGGPIIGAQLENEYGLHGPGRGTEHLLKLKQLAIAAGIDPPVFSVTGWPSLDFPPREVVPVSGGYPDGFWYGSQTALPPSMTYLFNFNRELGDMGATVPSEDPTGKVDLKHDPYSAAEEAGGMASAYHRRPVISADDIAALTLTGIGSGMNLYGYYMFHGGANPQGKRTTLQESQATGYPNDLPVVSYDFGAPLGEFGQVRESYRKTRRIHLFLEEYGPSLATMPAFAPQLRVRDAADITHPRVAVRTDGKAGFVFVNNYVRQLAMTDHPGFQVRVKTPGGEIAVPARPVTLPAGAYFAWPFGLEFGKARLVYSTAQLLTQLDTPSGRLVVFFAVPGVAPEFRFDAATVRQVLADGRTVNPVNGGITFANARAGMDATISVTDLAGEKTTLLLLTAEQAERTARLHMGGADHLVLSGSTVFFDGARLHLRSTASPTQVVSVLPGLALAGVTGRPEGLWTSYRVTQPEKHPMLESTAMQTATPRAAMDMGPFVDWRKGAVPTVPPEAAFNKSATWAMRWKNPDMTGLSEMLLEIDYAGDMARLRSGDRLVDDNFFNGVPWQVGLKQVQGNPIALQILPMPAMAPIYLDERARTVLGGSGMKFSGAKLIPEYESVIAVSGNSSASPRAGERIPVI